MIVFSEEALADLENIFEFNAGRDPECVQDAGVEFLEKKSTPVPWVVGGNKYRLIAAIHYNRRRVYIRHVLTHAEYDKGKWKEQ